MKIRFSVDLNAINTAVVARSCGGKAFKVIKRFIVLYNGKKVRVIAFYFAINHKANLVWFIAFYFLKLKNESIPNQNNL